MLPEDSQHEIAPLIDAYLQMLGPSRLLRQARKRITDGLVTAETAVLDEVEALARAMLAAADEPEAARRCRCPAAPRRRDTRDRPPPAAQPDRGAFRSFAGVPQGAILVAETLRPADAALIDPARIAGLATEEGGTDGHTAIMLRALGVPAVLGVHGLLAAARTGTMAVLDGGAAASCSTRRRRAGGSQAGRGRLRARAAAPGAAAPAAPRRPPTTSRWSCRAIWSCWPSCR